ncbi:MAG: DUF4349 domain-containing protein [Erysipelotrichaceae bacterium]|nr:DUF4349 domain-containing protein [Erysipelotrichaceae bacterium]
MKTDKLTDAIGMIDDTYIKEAHEEGRKEKRRFRLPEFRLSWELMGKLATAGICLFLAIGILPELFHSYGKGASDGAYNSYGSSYAVYDEETYAAEQMLDEGSVNEYKTDSSGQSADLHRDENKKMILTAHMQMETKDLDETVSYLLEKVGTYSGYVQKSSSYTRNSTTRIYEATLRIPANSYSEFISELKTAGNTLSYSDEIEDVTDSYTDIEARISSLKAQEAKVLEFYDKAETIEDLMNIESRLSDLRYQIEYYEAQIKNYDLLIAYSTLYITVTETTVYTPENPGFFSRLAGSFTDGWHDFMGGIGDFLVDVVYNIWTILLLAGLGYLAYRIYRKIRNRKNQK